MPDAKRHSGQGNVVLDLHRSAPLQAEVGADGRHTPTDVWHIAEWDDVFWTVEPSAQHLIDLTSVTP